MPTTLPIFLNPHAGRGAEAEQEALRQAFQQTASSPDIRVLPPAQIENAIRAEAERSTSVIGVAGGDGTISSAANALANTSTTLLPIPLGTLNHFCNRHGIDGLDAAVLAWQRGEASKVPVGVVNERVFVNNASCGFYPHLVRHRERIERLLPRGPAMWLGALRVLLEFPMMQLDLEIAGDRKHLRTPALWVGIGRNSLRLPEHEEPRITGEKVLEIVAGRAQTRRRAVQLAFRLLRHLKRGLEPRAPKLIVERAPRFTLKAKHGVDIALDGEPFRMRGPLDFAYRENALSVLSLVDAAGRGYLGPR